MDRMRLLISSSASGPESPNGYFKTYLNDPLARLLLDRWKVTPLRFGLVVFIFYVLSNTLVAWLFGLYNLPPGMKGILQDWPASILYEMVITPVVVGYYLWTAVAPAITIQRIRDAKLLDMSPSDFDDLVLLGTDSIKAWFNRWYWLVLVLAILVPFSAYALTWHLQISFGYLSVPPRWFQYNSIYLVVFKYIPWVFEWYMLMMLIARELVTIRAIRHLFRHRELKLYPLHPDGCGGLRPLSDYALTFTYCIATAGLALSIVIYKSIMAGTFASDYQLFIAGVAYLVLAPTTFFAPLGTAHTAMKKAKDQLLMKISDQFMKDIESTYSELGGSAAGLKDNVLKIEQLQRVYDTTRQFPVWPFDAGTLRRFFATILTPVLPVLLTALQEVILNKVLPLLR